MTKARRTNLFFLGLIVFYIFACFYIVPYLPDFMRKGNFSMILGQIIIILPVIAYVILSRGEVIRNIRFKLLGVTDIILLVIFTICMVPVISFINSVSMMFVENHLVEQLDGMQNNPLWLNIVLTALIPAIVEEITFRGMLYCGYRDSRIKYAILASALLFGLFHMNINQLCYAFVMAVVFALLYEATGSIFATMIVHFTFNANTVVLQKIVHETEKLIVELAEKDESYKEFAQEITDSSESVTSYASMSGHEKIQMLVPLFISAVIMGSLAFFILRKLAKRANRLEHINGVIRSFAHRGVSVDDTDCDKIRNYEVNEGYREYGDYEGCEGGRKDECSGETTEYGGKIVDMIFILGVVLCVIFMIITGI